MERESSKQVNSWEYADACLEVAAKSRLGDWESDTLAGSGSSACLASHVERVSQYAVLAKLRDGTAAGLNAGTMRAFARHGNLPRRTITADNGKEFAAHAELTGKLGLEVYFARPYHAWERGLNENVNGLVRQFFPKGLDLAAVTDGQVRRVQHLLNTRPRKTLGYARPWKCCGDYERHPACVSKLNPPVDSVKGKNPNPRRKIVSVGTAAP